MRKVILSVLVAGSLLATSCKKAKEAKEEVKDTTEAVVDKTKTVVDEAKTVVEDTKKAVESVLEGVTIPEFKDAKVGEYLNEYAQYAKDYLAAGKDVVKNADLAKKGVALATKSQEVMKSIASDAEATKKFSATLAAIQSKMAPAAAK